jgi:chitin disaccharide deacetylase
MPSSKAKATMQQQSRRPSLVIVNADDWGHSPAHTDAIARCFASDRLTSTTAMVYMHDSGRAASLAREIGLPTGLHLNLIEPYDSAGVALGVRSRHMRLVDHFKRGGMNRWLVPPRLARLVSDVISDQQSEFLHLYGAEPTHTDGHQHLHLNIAVLASPRLRRGSYLRPSPAFTYPQKSRPNLILRQAVNRLIRLRFSSPDYFVNVRSLFPELSDGDWPLRPLPNSGIVEIMTHPGRPDEFRLLMSPAWLHTIASMQLGSYRDL